MTLFQFLKEIHGPSPFFADPPVKLLVDDKCHEASLAFATRDGGKYEFSRFSRDFRKRRCKLRHNLA